MRNLTPHWITARHPGLCRCGKHIPVGGRAFYWPRYRTMECETCGSKSDQAINAERSKEQDDVDD